MKKRQSLEGRIGIYGFGEVGKSYLDYLLKVSMPVSSITICDTKQDFPERGHLIIDHLSDTVQSSAVPITFTRDVERFMAEQDVILMSPGVDSTVYSDCQHKMMNELAIFTGHWDYPTIAVTGSLGKTSLVTFIDAMLRDAGYRTVLGGNIGIPLLSFVTRTPAHTGHEENAINFGIFELSSFQLELPHAFAPKVAILTNLYPNHLDRHGTVDAYYSAKYSLFQHQTEQHISILPLSVAHTIRTAIAVPDRPLSFFSTSATAADIAALYENGELQLQDTVFTLQNTQHEYHVIQHTYQGSMVIAHLAHACCDVTFLENWLILYAVLTGLGIKYTQDLKPILEKAAQSSLPHRLEKVGVFDGIHYYNDSKSTVMDATHAALNTLIEREHVPVLLILGGTSKGVDRYAAIQQLPTQYMRSIICFGGEAEQLARACCDAGIPCSQAETLEQAVLVMHNTAQKNDHILFSPGGASHDLFSHYAERGNRFKQLILNPLE